MIIMALLNGSGQIVKYALSIINGHVINHHFSHVGEGGGVFILVQEFVS